MRVCADVMHKRATKAAKLLKRRIDAAVLSDTQIVIVCHFPSTWTAGASFGGHSFAEMWTNPHVHVLYIGAHVHSTDNTSNVHSGSRRKGWRDFCVGGGGGWACDGHQGFMVGEVLEDGKVSNLRLKMIDDSTCCTAHRAGH